MDDFISKQEDAASRGIDVDTDFGFDDIEEGDTLAVRQVGKSGEEKFKTQTVVDKADTGFVPKIGLEGGRQSITADQLGEDAFLPGDFGQSGSGGEELGFGDLMDAHESRSKTARIADESKQAKKAPSKEAWMDNPDQFDWPGIDDK